MYCLSFLKDFENNFLNNTSFISSSNKLPSLSLLFPVGWLTAALSQEVFSYFILAPMHTSFWIFLLPFLKISFLLKFIQPTEQCVWATFHFQNKEEKVALTNKSYGATSDADRMQFKSYPPLCSPTPESIFQCATSEQKFNTSCKIPKI
jgi:hypothetical protein